MDDKIPDVMRGLADLPGYITEEILSQYILACHKIYDSGFGRGKEAAYQICVFNNGRNCAEKRDILIKECNK